jgi:hypothetical protein
MTTTTTKRSEKINLFVTKNIAEWLTVKAESLGINVSAMIAILLAQVKAQEENK